MPKIPSAGTEQCKQRNYGERELGKSWELKGGGPGGLEHRKREKRGENEVEKVRRDQIMQKLDKNFRFYSKYNVKLLKRRNTVWFAF